MRLSVERSLALLEAGFLSTREARRKWRELVDQPYDLPGVIVAVLATLQRAMRRNPPELPLGRIPK